jgi:hypothetical protein
MVWAGTNESSRIFILFSRPQENILPAARLAISFAFRPRPEPERARHVRYRNPEAVICPISKRFLPRFFLGLLRCPDWFRLLDERFIGIGALGSFLELLTSQLKRENFEK